MISKKGFSLIEMIVVVIVIGVIATIIITYNSNIKQPEKEIITQKHTLKIDHVINAYDLQRNGIYIMCLDNYEYIVSLYSGMHVIQIMDQDNKPKRCKN